MAKKMNFEDAVAKLEECSEKLKSGQLSLEESAKVYEESVQYFHLCNKILQETKHKIEIYRPETGETEDFDY